MNSVINTCRCQPTPEITSRRQFLERLGSGFGLLALGWLLDQENLLALPTWHSDSGLEFLRTQASSLRRQGQEHYFLVHAWGRQSRGHV